MFSNLLLCCRSNIKIRIPHVQMAWIKCGLMGSYSYSSVTARKKGYISHSLDLCSSVSYPDRLSLTSLSKAISPLPLVVLHTQVV